MLQALQTHRKLHDGVEIAFGFLNIASTYNELNLLDSALYYVKAAWELRKYDPQNEPAMLALLGTIQMKNGNLDVAQQYFEKAILLGEHNKDFRSLSYFHAYLAQLYRQKKDIDSSIVHAKWGIQYGQKGPFNLYILRKSDLLTELYDSINPKEALHYYRMSASVKEGLYGAGNLQTIHEEARQRDIEAAKAEYQNRLRQLALLGGLGVILIIALIFGWIK